jgi:putative membrane protein
MAYLTEQDKERIRTAIRDAEANTTGELVTVIAQASDSYLFIPILWAALVAFAVPVLALWSGYSTDVVGVSIVQLGVFCALALLGRWRRVRYYLVPTGVKKARAARLAREQFFARGVRETVDRTGILIFVSVAERHVEILADSGISEKVDSAVWRKAVDSFVGHVRSGQVAEGFLAAIRECGAVLTEHFPASGPNPDELPDHLFEL